jgi:hypothetical protein
VTFSPRRRSSAAKTDLVFQQMVVPGTVTGQASVEDGTVQFYEPLSKAAFAPSGLIVVPEGSRLS